MNNGWIKVHRQLLDNDLFRNDHNALVLFLALLLLVDHRDGTYSTGRFRLSDIVGMNPNTMYKSLKRLEKYEMVTCSSNSLRTVIVICNWRNYQGDGNKLGNSQVTAREQPSNTKQERRNKNIEYIYSLYIDKFARNPLQFKLTKQRELKIKARLDDAGQEMLERAIINTSKSAFHNGENDRGWRADLDFIIRNYEQVEKLSNLQPKSSPLEQAKQQISEHRTNLDMTDEQRRKNVDTIAKLRKDFLNGRLKSSKKT